MKEMGGDIQNGQILLLEPGYRTSLYELIIETAKQRGFITSSDTSFSLEDLNLGSNVAEGETEKIFRVILNAYFTEDPNKKGHYTVSLPGIAKIVVSKAKRDSPRELYYEELIDRIADNINFLFPREFIASIGELQLSAACEAAIKENYFISDNIEYNAPIHTYLPKNCIAHLADHDTLSEHDLTR